MGSPYRRLALFLSICVILTCSLFSDVPANDTVLMSYGGHRAS